MRAGPPAGRVDDLQHRAQSDDGLAGTDLSLEQPVHGVVAPQVRGDRRPGSLLTKCELKGQRTVEGPEQAAGDRRAWLGDELGG